MKTPSQPPASSGLAMPEDDAWIQWGDRDPYFAVLTDPRYRSTALDDAARAAFFTSGQEDVDRLMRLIDKAGDGAFAPRRTLDYGCGVGRLLPALAKRTVDEVVGADIAPAMLIEAAKNVSAADGCAITLVEADDQLGRVTGLFDLVHSYIVLQHIRPERGRRLFERLVDRIAPGGWGALHVAYGWDYHAASLGVPPDAPPASRSTGRRGRGVVAAESASDPPLDMHFYNLSELFFITQRAGALQIQSSLTDHGGVRGALLVFQRG